MKKLFLLLMVVITTTLFGATNQKTAEVSNYYNDLGKLSNDQRKVLVEAYIAGESNKLEKTLVAISWIESSLGERLENLSDGKYGSYGRYHALMETVLDRHGMKADKSTRIAIAKKLKTDPNFANSEVIAELTYWSKVHKNKNNPYREMLASYNAGTKGLKSGAGQSYANDVVKRVKAIELYMKDNKQLITAYKSTEQAKTILATNLKQIVEHKISPASYISNQTEIHAERVAVLIKYVSPSQPYVTRRV